MIQRVGIAQAILNEPDVVFLDEPMSGLDPLGRRDVRRLILGLRARGSTVFFSSHILSDAEVLCDRVAIVAGGRLVSCGRLAELLPFDLKGWEVVLADVTASSAGRLAGRVRHFAALPDGRAAVELSPEDRPERFLQEVGAEGIRVVSVNPVRTTLEDYFVQAVGQAAPRQG
jgi:ABC-2 type transport system ATP-binding protein